LNLSLTILWVLFRHLSFIVASLSHWIWATMSSMAPSPLFLQIASMATLVVLSQIACKSVTCEGITYRARSK
jgi:hypothetical protein